MHRRHASSILINALLFITIKNEEKFSFVFVWKLAAWPPISTQRQFLFLVGRRFGDFDAALLGEENQLDIELSDTLL
jgi:hypothetical protein